MHGESWQFLSSAVADFADLPVSVLEFGSRDVNGTPRPLFTHPGHSYWGVDIVGGPGVDEVGDASQVAVTVHGGLFDVVICAEVFEHTPDWVDIIINMDRHLKPGGVVIITAAAPPRPAHSAIDGRNLEVDEYTAYPLPDDDREWYENVDPDLLRDVMSNIFDEVEVSTNPRGDVYARAIGQGVTPL